MMIVLEIFTAIATIALGVALDYSLTKRPYDDKHKIFHIKTHWWRWRKDNVLVSVLAATVAAVTSDVWAVPVIKKYLDWHELVEHMTGLGAVAISTAFAYLFFMKLLGWPPKEI